MKKGSNISMMKSGEMKAVTVGAKPSMITTFMFIFKMVRKYFPYRLLVYFEKYFYKLFDMYWHKIVQYFSPYISITIYELTGDRLQRSGAYTKIQAYLSSTSCSKQVKQLKADVGKDSKKLDLSVDDNGEIVDVFEGVKIWWSTRKKISKSKSFSFYPTPDEKRYLTLTFHERDRDIVSESYLNYVMNEGEAIRLKNRQRKLFTNNPSSSWHGHSVWSHVVFNHPATFDNLAMDPEKKQEIIDDLVTFRNGRSYYNNVGKAWKRGYLLYGPPGTGKSTMIAAIANFLNYDVYDLELTAVKQNSELRKLLIETSNKSVIVIEDIDCSLDLTGQRKKEKDKEEEEEKDPVKTVKNKAGNANEVTLSGLLNFIDGLWSTCGDERVIIFTTNYVKKLDPALVRRGRMDKHIELSYCGFEGFKVLAKNYLKLDSHDLFETIGGLLEDVQMTPADVAENLMPKTASMDAETCLKKLIKALEDAKEQTRLKAEKQAQKKSMAGAKMKASGQATKSNSSITEEATKMIGNEEARKGNSSAATEAALTNESPAKEANEDDMKNNSSATEEAINNNSLEEEAITNNSSAKEGAKLGESK